MNTDQAAIEHPARRPFGEPRERPAICVQRNLAIGWSSLAVGAISGLILGLWSFDGPLPAPEMLADYGSLSRRLMRLGHIAFFGLGLINILMARQIAATPRPVLGRTALACMNFGNLLLPPALMAAALHEPLKYFTSLPAFAVSAALILVATTAVRDLFESGR